MVAGQSAATGTIKGVVRTAVRQTLPPLKVTSDQQVCGTSLPDESLSLGTNGAVMNAVVIVSGVKGAGGPQTLVLTNRKCAFQPRVQLAAPKALVTVTSEDPMLHNTHVYDEKDYSLFNVALPAPGVKLTRPVREAGIVKVKCDVHPWMRGFIIVTDEPTSVTMAEGTFEIPNVPAGTHQVRVWHEQLKGPTQPVTVVAGQVATIDFTLVK